MFLAGLDAAGYQVGARIDRPVPGDVLVLWNRPPAREPEARRFEASGARVLVVENGYLGKMWLEQKWFSMAIGHHAGAGKWVDGGSERWDSWGVEMQPWRTDGEETVILAQRGIGEVGIASPRGWAEEVRRRIGGRVRSHPGINKQAVPLAEDLKNASSVVTWHSSAALHALLMGIPVWSGFKRWIGAGAARPLAQFGSEPKREDADRLETFRRLAWAMWTADEVAAGVPFQRLLS